MALSLSALAIEDLDSILAYSESRWGQQRAVLYVNALENAFSALLVGSERGKLFYLSGRALRRTLVGRHHTYFERTPATVFFSRVLHGAMNVYLLEFSKTQRKSTMND